MALYQYVAISETGRSIKDVIEASHEKEAEEKLQKKNINVTHLKLFDSSKKIVLSQKDILNFTEGLSKLLEAGLPLHDGLVALKDKYEKHKIFPLILDLSDQVKKGESFSKALSSYSENFDFIYCSMVANAEKTGMLKESLDDLSKAMNRNMKLKKKVVGALLYPAILSVFCFVVIFSLIFFVIPSISDLFDGKNLHPLTSFVLAVSNLAVSMKGFLISFFIIFVFSLAITFSVRNVKQKVYKLFISLPGLRNLMLSLSLVRFSRSFSILLSTGISYVDALKLAKEVMKNPLLEKDIAYAEKKIVEGQKLSHALKSRENIPRLVIRMLEIAEESGKMPEMLLHIAKNYEDDLEKKITSLTGVLQPILLLILGVVVGFIVLSVLLPLTDVSSFIG